MENLQELTNKYSLEISKEKLITELYYELQIDHQVALLNEKYLIVDGVIYSFRKNNKQGKWIVK